MEKPKYYLTASLLNAWLGGYDSFYDMLYRRESEPNEKMLKGIEFEEKAIKGEIEELKPYVEGALYQPFVCKECEGYMLLGFCDLINKDTIYDLKNNSNVCTLSGGETEDGKIVIPESVLGEKLKIFIFSWLVLDNYVILSSRLKTLGATGDRI